ncbi:carbonic anhydrase family protein [Uliginosibacterium sp. 31-16]|uniref:carbonic anhydrase n=1 Tax=Uliginosibacterium sp. 31-16 TaxID=3068315 RepID=UPI00273F9982|nr:surface-adhesin E family protein [Uliginosibacterium sp. 31-16]MDP5239178.1 carbonic anhydrase family protein [Uliginosibacterium sp. 31-16]
MRKLFACLSLSLALPAMGADWVSVASDKLRTVEIDRGSVMDSDDGSKVAWGRIVLSDAQAAKAGYKTVRALNRYDCHTRSFTIVKRVYLSADDEALHEEAVNAKVATPVRPGTVDERFFNTVCPQPVKAKTKNLNLNELAREAERRAAEAAKSVQNRPGSTREPMARADLKLVKDVAPASDTPAPKTAEKIPAEAAQPVSPAAGVAPRTSTAPMTTYRSSPPPAYSPKPVAPKAPKARSPEPASVAAPLPPAHNPHAHWSYEGETGPEFWGSLSPENSTCRTGTRQSPIDIREGIKVDQEAIQFDYKPSYFRIIDNGHTIQVNYGQGSRLAVMGREFELVQFHFHRPSEERIEGRAFDMVAHLVHKDLNGKLAVVSVLLEGGSANPFIQTLWNNLPLEQNAEYTPKTPLQIADLLPARRDYFAYMGSLTTPPCTEGVLWLVLKQPVQLSAEQIGVFARFYANNARPVQNPAGRVIKESR